MHSGWRGPVKLLAPGLRRQTRSMECQKLRRWKPWQRQRPSRLGGEQRLPRWQGLASCHRENR